MDNTFKELEYEIVVCFDTNFTIIIIIVYFVRKYTNIYLYHALNEIIQNQCCIYNTKVCFVKSLNACKITI